MTLRAFSILAGLLCMAAVTGARGQEPQRLTLPAALDLGENQNLDLVAARARRAAALAGVAIARQRPNPTVVVGAARDLPHESLMFDQPIEIGSKRTRRIEVARAEGSVTDAEITALERRVRRRVREAYFGLAFARRITEQRADIVKLAQRLSDIARARFDSGDIPELEVTQAGLEVFRTQADLQVAQQEERVARGELNAMLNVPSLQPWEIESPLESPPPALPLEDLAGRAAGSNAEIIRLAREAKAEENRRDQLRAERTPDLVVELGADFNSPPDFRTGPRGQLSIELPLFNRKRGEIARASANLQVLGDESTAARRVASKEVETAYYELDARRLQVSLYGQTLVPTSQKLEELAEESYRAGKVSILTVLDAQRSVQQVERDYLDSLLAMQVAFARLEEIVGASLD